MKKLLLLSLVLLTGCYEQSEQRRQVEDAIYDRACTVDQMKIVDEQTHNCSENGGYLEYICYGTAMVRNCPLRGEEVIR